jgi:uncharacterized protein YlxP (DUF503 family)
VHVGTLLFDVRIPLSHSLKEKRAVIKPILEGARRRFQVAAAEVAFEDQWQRAELGMAAVAASAGHVEEVLGQVERFVWSFPEIEVLRCDRSWVDA